MNVVSHAYRRSLVARLSGIALLLASFQCTGANEVGATDGALSVTPAGKASYAVPIEVPPGIGDVAPSVAIQYVSGGANGVAGEGGTLSAVASITRCPASEEEDEFTGAVSHDADDRFCLNGQKLVGIGGTYGEAGAEYRTRIETFKRVRSHGALPYPNGGSGPESFVVEGGNGSRAEFGSTPGSRIANPETGVVDQWLLARSVDVHGNEIVYQYADFAAGDAIERHLERIDYGGNAGEGVSHHLAVVFNYETRPDSSSGYRRGMRLAQSQRLASVHTEADGAVARRYALSYANDGGSGASRLLAVQECSSDGATCYNPTTFHWTDPATGFSAAANAVPDNLLDDVGRRRGVLSDLNADGRIDWITAYVDAFGTTHRSTWLQSPNGWIHAPAFEAPVPLFDHAAGTAGTSTAELVDLDGDGLPDVVEAWRDAAGNDHHGAWLNTGAGFVPAPAWHLPDVLVDLSAGAQGIRRAQLMQRDHDAFIDLVVSIRLPSGSVEQLAWTNTGAGWAPDTPSLPVAVNDYAASAIGMANASFMDLDGDGFTDIVQALVRPDGTELRTTWLGRESGFAESSAWRLPVPTMDYRVVAKGEPRAELVDVNGDGLLDLVQSHASQAHDTETAAWLNTGAGWLPDPSFIPPALLTRTLADGRRQALGALMHLNGDGKPDFVTSYRKSGGGVEQKAWVRNDTGWTSDNARALPAPLFQHLDDDDGFAASTLLDVNGDNAPDLVATHAASSSTTWLNAVGASGRAENRVIDRIVNGLGFEQRIEYQHSDDTDVYTPAPERGTPPVVAVDGPMRLVGAVETSDGLGGFNRSEYRYGALRVDVHDGRHLGFGWMSVRDTLTDSEVTSEFSQAWPHVGSLVRTTTRVGAAVISEEDATFEHLTLNGGKSVFPYESGRTATSWELDGQHVATVSSTVEVDAFGAPVRATGTTSDATGTYTKTVENTYDHDTANWILSKATRNVTTVTAPNTPAITRTVDFAFNADGMLVSTTRQPGHPHALITTYTYDGFGNRVSTTATANGEDPRTGSVVFSADGRFPLAATNAGGHVSEQTYDGATGNLLTSTDPNGIVVTKTYDPLGFPLNETRTHVDDAGETTTGVRATLRHWCSASTSCPDNALYFASAFTDEGDAPETVYYDLAGREVRRQSRGFAEDGGESPIVYRDIEYNARGQQARVSGEYFAGDTPEWTAMAYDALDRPITRTGADGSITRTVYEGRTRRTRNALGAESTVVVNATGKPVRAIDAAGSETTFEYDAAGRLVRTTDPHGNRITTTYDALGRKVAMSDPDKGDWTYAYNAFGELVSQTDAKGQTTTMAYDALGRVVSRIEPDGETTWQYDSAVNGIGRLDTVSQDNGYTRSHAYDDRGRPITETVTLDGRTFVTHYRYQGTSERVDHVIYPSGLVVRRSYDLYGHPLDIKSDGLVELEAYQAQQAIVSQQEADLQALFDTLQPQWDDHHAQMTAFINAARPHANEARRLSAEANRLIDEAGDALAQARSDYQHASQYTALAKRHDAAARAYAHSMINHREICDDPDSTAGQIEFHCVWETKQLVAGQQALKDMAEDAQRSNAFAARAADYQNIAEDLFDEAAGVINAANAAERAANNRYAQANTHVEALHAIEQQLADADNALQQAIDKAEALQAAYHGAATTHWTAEAANAAGHLTRFTQGNGVSTAISHFADTGRISAIHATGDPAVPAALSTDGMQALIDRIDALIIDYNADLIDYQGQGANARADKTAAEQQADLARAQADGYRAGGQGAYATVLEAEAFQHDVDAAVFATRITLNDGLVAIHQNTVAGAADLVLDYETRLGEAGAGRALEAAFHHLLVQHHQGIDALYASLAYDFDDLQAASGDVAAPDATTLATFAELATHSRHRADLNELRADAWQANAVAALDGAGGQTTPLSRRALGLDANLIEKQAALIDLFADATEAVADHAAPLNEANARYQAELGRIVDDSPYQARTAATLDRVAQGRRLADLYASRGVAILAELDAELAQAAAGDDTALDNPFEALVIDYSTEADLYAEMSGADYWSDLYAALGGELAGVAARYQAQAGENARLAEEHGARATTAENAASHQVRLGTSGEIVHERYTYDTLGRLTARHDDAVGLTETYQYDALSRLTESRVSGPGAELYAFAGLDTVTYTYDALGNLTHRSDIGAYTYGGTRPDGSAIGPHAVTRIDRLDGSHTTFAYDANGHMSEGDGRAITVTSFDKPAAITATGAVTAPTLLASDPGAPSSHLTGGPGSGTYTYGPERQLVKHVETVGGQERTTYLIGGLYEHLITPAGETSRFNITYAGAVVAVIENTADDAPDTHYLHTDRLGSVVALSDEHGYLVDRYRFDPFGQRRQALYDATAASAENLIAITARGYTGHRELAGVGLVHMGGRVYHPGIGRFLSADPFIQSPLSSQSYNRYSYLWNSPLNGTDPSGYFSYNANIPQHLSGVETWQYIASDQFNLPTPTNVNWSLSQARAHYRAEKDRANLLIQAELPHINRNFSREELYAIGTGQRDIGLSAQAQKRINGVINQAYQWRELARQIKKANKWYRKYGGQIIANVLMAFQVPPPIANAVGAMVSARVNGASVGDTLKAGGKGYIASEAYAQVGGWKTPGAKILGHAAIGGIMSDWNGGSFTDGALAAAVGKMGTEWSIAMGFGELGNFFTTVAAAGISAEITGGDTLGAMLIASTGWYANYKATQRDGLDSAEPVLEFAGIPRGVRCNDGCQVVSQGGVTIQTVATTPGQDGIMLRYDNAPMGVNGNPQPVAESLPGFEKITHMSIFPGQVKSTYRPGFPGANLTVHWIDIPPQPSYNDLSNGYEITVFPDY